MLWSRLDTKRKKGDARPGEEKTATSPIARRRRKPHHGLNALHHRYIMAPHKMRNTLTNRML
jgi:hypothetical protein